MRGAVQLIRRDLNGSELRVLVTNEDVVPTKVYRPSIMRVDPDAPRERKKEILNSITQIVGANSYEIGEGRTVKSSIGGGFCERDYAVVLYVISDEFVQRALDIGNRSSLELGPEFF